MTPLGHGPISAERRARNPLIDADGAALLHHLIDHVDAPRWNHELGDRVNAEDLAEVDRFRRTLEAPAGEAPGLCPATLGPWLEFLRSDTPFFRERLTAGLDPAGLDPAVLDPAGLDPAVLDPAGLDPAVDWALIPTTSREDLVVHIEQMVPLAADLSRLIVYDTSGSTGHALRIPHHPRAVALSLPMVERAIALHGRRLPPTRGKVVVLNVCAQRHSFVFANVLSAWAGGAMVKLNLHPASWPGGRESARRYLEALDPLLITGDPVSLLELLAWAELRPLAALSTAVRLDEATRRRVEAGLGAPVINWYSTTETGPLAIACERSALHLFLPDVYVEIADPSGVPLPPGEQGEVVVTGGRNPYLPLLRYRTGDHASLGQCPCGLETPVLIGLQGRDPVVLRSADGAILNPVDVGRALRLQADFAQHQCVQRADGRVELTLRPLPDRPLAVEPLRQAMAELFGAPVRMSIDPTLGLVPPYVSELE